MLEQPIRDKDITFLTKYLFNINLTPNQVEIVKIIAFSEDKRVCINAMTRWGKSLCVALGVALYIYFNENKKIILIAPTSDQSEIIRNYIAQHIISCYRLARLVEIEKDSSIERLKKETSRKRWTFKNGCELRIISAHGEAERILGFGGDLIIIDEASLISREAYAKIVRMLGDDPEKSILIELSNPWTRDCKYYDHYSSSRFKTIHIPYEVGLEEGRVTQTFIDEMKQELSDTEFTVLYKSEFPDESVDSLLRLSWINSAIERKAITEGNRIISCDVSDKGMDKTVYMIGTEKNGFYSVQEIHSENISDNMQIANRIFNWCLEKNIGIVNVDCIGVGVGVISRLKELCKDKPIKVNPCHFGESPFEENKLNLPTSPKKRFLNKKAEQYFRLRSLLEQGQISFPLHQTLKSELLKMKWEMTSSEKIRIIDPEDKSPDFADGLCYFQWKERKEATWFEA